MRRSLVGALVVASGLAFTATGRAAVGASGSGTYLTPFREDGATFNATTGQFSGGRYLNQTTDANGCVANGSSISPTGNPQAYRCLPAAAASLQLPDGRVLFWDNLEGTENIQPSNTDPQGLPVTIVTDGGRLTVNDEARLLSLGTKGPVFTKTSPVDGGAHDATKAEDLPLPPPLAATHYAYNNGALFCSDQLFLANGDVLDVGGTDWYTDPTIPGTDKGVAELQGMKATRIFDPASETWTQVAPMNYARWYPSLVTLGNGQVFVAGGVTKLIKPVYPSHLADSGTTVRQTETFDPTVQPAGKWTDNGASAARSLPLFPRLHLLPDGHVFYDPNGQAFSPAGYGYDEALWNVAASYDPATKTWTNLGIPGLGTSAFPGIRMSTFSAALELRPDSAGNYSRASYLTAGGVFLPTPGSYVAIADSRIETVTIGAGGTETMATAPTGPLGRGRWYSTAVPLPDGTVYAVNGADVDEVVTPGVESPIRRAELFTPALSSTGGYTGGSWRDVGDVARGRTYHNTAILLPDGSVLIAGHAPIPSLYYQTMDLPTGLPGRPAANDFHDPSFQIWEPPYFDQPRPTVTAISPSSGRALTVQTPDAATITSVVLVRNTAITHLIDADNRTVKLPVVSRDAASVTVQLPASTNVLPNGPYLLFANRGANGDPAKDIPGQVVPSIGRQVFVEGTSVPRVVPVATSSLVVASSTALPTVAATSARGHAAGTGSVVAAPPVPRRSAALVAVTHRRELPAAVVALVALLGLLGFGGRRLQGFARRDRSMD